MADWEKILNFVYSQDLALFIQAQKKLIWELCEDWCGESHGHSAIPGYTTDYTMLCTRHARHEVGFIAQYQQWSDHSCICSWTESDTIATPCFAHAMMMQDKWGRVYSTIISTMIWSQLHLQLNWHHMLYTTFAYAMHARQMGWGLSEGRDWCVHLMVAMKEIIIGPRGKFSHMPYNNTLGPMVSVLFSKNWYGHGHTGQIGGAVTEVCVHILSKGKRVSSIVSPHTYMYMYILHVQSCTSLKSI